VNIRRHRASNPDSPTAVPEQAAVLHVIRMIEECVPGTPGVAPLFGS
jgi:hypothetical protein